MLTIEQINALQKSQLESLLEIAVKAFAGFGKLAELNLQAAKTSLLETQDATKAASGAKSVQELFALQSALLQPAIEKAVAYGKHVHDILAATQAEMSTVAEAQVHAAETRFATSFDSAVKGAPSGSETMTAVVKSVVDAASNAMDTLHKASKQATDLAAANLNTMSLSTIKATHGVAKSARQAA